MSPRLTRNGRTLRSASRSQAIAPRTTYPRHERNASIFPAPIEADVVQVHKKVGYIAYSFDDTIHIIRKTCLSYRLAPSQRGVKSSSRRIVRPNYDRSRFGSPPVGACHLDSTRDLFYVGCHSLPPSFSIRRHAALTDIGISKALLSILARAGGAGEIATRITSYRPLLISKSARPPPCSAFALHQTGQAHDPHNKGTQAK